MKTTLSLLVLRCSDVLASKRFYEALGMEFTPEQHGSGPVHWSCQPGELVLELYPAGGKPPSLERLGFTTENLDETLAAVRNAGGRVLEASLKPDSAVVVAPGGAHVELTLRSLHDETTWQVWRQDDNGNRAILSRNHTKPEAERLAREFEQRGHKQMYWASEELA